MNRTSPVLKTLSLLLIFSLIQLSSTSMFTFLDVYGNPDSYLDKQGQLLSKKYVLFKTLKQSAFIYTASFLIKGSVIGLEGMGIITSMRISSLSQVVPVFIVETLFTVLHSLESTNTYFNIIKTSKKPIFKRFSGDKFQIVGVLIYISLLFFLREIFSLVTYGPRQNSPKSKTRDTEILMLENERLVQENMRYKVKNMRQKIILNKLGYKDECKGNDNLIDGEPLEDNYFKNYYNL